MVSAHFSAEQVTAIMAELPSAVVPVFDTTPFIIATVAVVVTLLLVMLQQQKRPRAVVTELWTYPIKGCRGVRVSSATFDANGFVQDRRYMIVRVDDNGGPAVFQHQRVLPRMVLISPSFDGSDLLIEAAEQQVRVPLLDENHGSLRTVRVWDSIVDGAVDQGDDAAKFLSRFLGTPTCVRPVPAAFRARGTANTTSFADGFPFLLTSEETVSDVNKRADDMLDVRRFRPNIVVRGQGPFAEDSWKRLSINGMTFFGVKKCTRCRVTTVNPDDGTGNDPSLDALKALRTFRLEDDGESVCLGLNMMPKWNARIASSSPRIHVGAEVMVDAVGKIRYKKDA